MFWRGLGHVKYGHTGKKTDRVISIKPCFRGVGGLTTEIKNCALEAFHYLKKIGNVFAAFVGDVVIT